MEVCINNFSPDYSSIFKTLILSNIVLPAVNNICSSKRSPLKKKLYVKVQIFQIFHLSPEATLLKLLYLSRHIELSLNILKMLLSTNLKSMISNKARCWQHPCISEFITFRNSMEFS